MPETTRTNGMPEATVKLTALECKALRMAAIFGTPTPTPPEVASATAKLAAAEYAINLDGGRDA
jgi:hypothetical protein